MNRIYLENVYHRQNEQIKEYKEIFLETNIGILKVHATSLDFENVNELTLLERVAEIDIYKEKYGKLYIEQVRRTYDNDIYLLISGKFILVIEYVLNSNIKHSLQDFRIIDDLDSSNKIEFDDFKELDIIELPTKN